MKKQEVDHILTRMLDSHSNVSDLNLTVGKPLQVESAGELVPVEIKPDIKELTPFQTETFALNLINQDRRLTETLVQTGSCDLSYSLPGKARFRVNVFSQTGNYSIVLRKLESKIPTIRDLNLPDTFYKIAKDLNGIVFVTGATGSGKSTSLAAILERSTRPVPSISLPWKTPSSISIPTRRPPSISGNWGPISTTSPAACAPPCVRPPR